MWVHVTIHLSKTKECTTPRVSPKANYGPRMILMSQCSFIHCNICNTLLAEVDNGGAGHGKGGYACVGAECKWEVSILSSQLCSEPKNCLKNKVLKN